jgi:hypothetical protein
MGFHSTNKTSPPVFPDKKSALEKPDTKESTTSVFPDKKSATRNLCLRQTTWNKEAPMP